MPSFREITANRARVSFQYGGVTVQMEYAPALLTEKAIANLQLLMDRAKTDIQENARAINEALCQFVTWWDITEDDAGQVTWPLTLERLVELPLLLRAEALIAVMSDTRMGELSGAPSPRPSAVTPAPAAPATSATRASKPSRKRTR